MILIIWKVEGGGIDKSGVMKNYAPGKTLADAFNWLAAYSGQDTFTVLAVRRV